MKHLFAAVLLLGCLSTAHAADPAKTTVVWISMDGFRGDYPDRTTLPFFSRLMKEGAYSRRFHPVFPPITFPSHCSEATGVGVAEHGITGNDFYDTATKQVARFPADSTLLEAEPIWLTAARQGVRTLVFDWPLSQKQPAALHDAYFNEAFDKDLSDTQRLDRILQTWKQDDDSGRAKESGGALRLLMGYVEKVDVAGHKFGPDSPEIMTELQTLDHEIGDFADKAQAYWKEHAGPADRFYLLLTTDHGMSNVAQNANLEKMLGLPHGQTKFAIETVGCIGNVFLDQVPAGAEREAQMAAFLEKLKTYPFIRAYRRADLPPAWDYVNPTRTGDIVVVLPPGYMFNHKVTRDVVAASELPDALKGMHGYPVEEDPDMYGVMFLARYPQDFGGKDLGEVNWDQYHPTVAQLLGIKPADGAKGKPLTLPGE